MGDASYGMQRITLAPHDVLVVFTDGLTESGPTREDILEVAGIRAFLERHVAEEYGRAGAARTAERTAKLLASRLLRSVDEYAGEGVRDDICLLVAVVEGA
jgi:serine phosphatase RsbU (regulator of sigma subunit)